MDLHRLAEERSRALHREIAARLAAEPSRVEEARARIARWASEGQLAPYYVERWNALLGGPLAVLLALLVAETEEATALRQTSPFAGIVDPRTRWRIWSEVRARLERAS
ncbi:MAG: hypothetical protein IPJ77_20695 [Planctomycetes bacterium]|nr:hypothetical protein [Planctomycetota bacterium]